MSWIVLGAPLAVVIVFKDLSIGMLASYINADNRAYMCNAWQKKNVYS